MKSYELNCLLNPKLNTDQIKEFTQSIVSFFEQTAKNENLTKINLSYPIKKERDAFLYIINFESPPQRIADLEKKLKSENKILRFQILSKKERRLAPKKVRLVRRTTPYKKPLSLAFEKAKDLPSLVKKKLPKKVEIEDIEKKLDEILGE